MTIYSKKKNWINKIHPSIRLLSAAIIIFVIALSYNIKTLFFGFIFSVLTAHLTKVKYKDMAKKLRSITIFLFLVWIFLPFSGKSKIETILGYLPIGLFIALQITIKSISISIIFISLISSMNITTIGVALKLLRIKKKITSLIIITYRYIFLIQKEYKKILETVKIRNFVAKNNVHTYKTFSYIIGNIFIRAYERGKKVQYALLCRSFDGNFPNKKKYVDNLKNVLFITYALLIILTLIIIEIHT